MYEVNHVCSFGKNCHSSFLLKKMNYKMESYPFDWIFSEIHIILDCIKNEFDKFLDKQYYSLPIESNIQRHEYYYNNDCYMFNHRNPLKDNDYEYYKRCVERFRKLIKNENNKLFVFFFNNHDPENLNELKIQLENFTDEIKNYIINFKILFIYNKKSDKREFKMYSINTMIDFLELDTVSESNGVHFLDEKDNDFLKLIVENEYIFNIMNL